MSSRANGISTVDLLRPSEHMGFFSMEPLLKGGNGDHRFFRFTSVTVLSVSRSTVSFFWGFVFNNKRFFFFFLFFCPFFFFLYSRFGWIEKSRTFERPIGFSNVVGQGLYDCMDKSLRSASQDSLSWGHLERPPFLS